MNDTQKEEHIKKRIEQYKNDCLEIDNNPLIRKKRSWFFDEGNSQAEIMKMKLLADLVDDLNLLRSLSTA